ncbi:MAG: hypothetical protein AVDCRST_MAG77-2524 [uncultured Chloroflexi bacterium]|uniref:Uncharacterized protein n=1 Tax=uncultured Chloroflexota bacterium TaxID=166587 RepID=A0A6J4ITU4_9CHLR|nr:MAG: hypothetical protein AVDCRST_MAG77-2524 [uncultured Chloroflexota bacterium]
MLPQVNETRRTVRRHNLCVVIQSMHELGISPEFGREAQAGPARVAT